MKRTKVITILDPPLLVRHFPVLPVFRVQSCVFSAPRRPPLSSDCHTPNERTWWTGWATTATATNVVSRSDSEWSSQRTMRLLIVTKCVVDSTMRSASVSSSSNCDDADDNPNMSPPMLYVLWLRRPTPGQPRWRQLSVHYEVEARLLVSSLPARRLPRSRVPSYLTVRAHRRPSGERISGETPEWPDRVGCGVKLSTSLWRDSATDAVTKPMLRRRDKLSPDR